MCYVGECFLDGGKFKKMCHTRTAADQLFLSTVQIDMSMPPIGWLCSVLIGFMGWHPLSLLNHILLHTASQQTSLLHTGLVHKACIYIWVFPTVCCDPKPVSVWKCTAKTSFSKIFFTDICTEHVMFMGEHQQTGTHHQVGYISSGCGCSPFQWVSSR